MLWRMHAHAFLQTPPEKKRSRVAPPKASEQDRTAGASSCPINLLVLLVLLDPTGWSSPISESDLNPVQLDLMECSVDKHASKQASKQPDVT